MTINEQVRKAAILEAVYNKGKHAGCNGHEIARGQAAALQYYEKHDQSSSHRAIKTGVSEAKRLNKAAAKAVMHDFNIGLLAH